MRRPWLALLLVVLMCQALYAQLGDLRLSLSGRGSYTTSSKLFYNPDSPSPTVRAQHLPFEDIFGWGIELRIQRAQDSYFLSLSADVLSTVARQNQLIALTNPPQVLPVREGLVAIPIELGLNTFVPIGSDKVRLFMGGGVGIYYAERILQVAGVNASRKNRPVSFGIHVVSGVEYQIIPRFALKADVRFRDPEISTINRFDQQSTVFNGKVISFPRGDMKTKINLDGLNFGIGVVVEVL